MSPTGLCFLSLKLTSPLLVFASICKGYVICERTLTSLFISSVLAGVAISTLTADAGAVAFDDKVVPDSCAVDVNSTSTNGIMTFNNLSRTASGAGKKVGDS